MIKLNSNKGITLAVLIVVIIVVIILLGVSINMGVDSINESIDEQFKSELYMVQQAIYQKQVEYEEKGFLAQRIGKKIIVEIEEDEYIVKIEEENIVKYKKNGTKFEVSEVYNKTKNEEYQKFVNIYAKVNGEELDIINKKYYLLQKIELEDLGLSGKRVEDSEFVVNYETGEVYNNSKKYYSNGVTPMYLPGYNKDEVTGEFKSDIIKIK